jgi:hypothetical protein
MPAYIHNQVLNQVSDVFCAASLWQTPGFSLFSRKNSVRDLLERFPREVRGKNISRCFCHVILSLPQEALEDDEHLARGNRARELIVSLTQKHQNDFGDLLDGEEVRYQIHADAQLTQDQVGVRFGHAVHIPGDADTLQGRLKFSIDGERWHPLGPVHAGQRLIQLANDPHLSSMQLPQWPFGNETSLLLINDGKRLQLRPKGKLACEFDAAAQCHVLRHERQQAFLKLEPVPTLRVADIWKARPASVDATARPQPTTPPAGRNDDLTWVPQSRDDACLQLVALALPRLDGYRELGIELLEIGFTRLLQICAASEAALCISVNSQNRIMVGNGQDRQHIALPTRFTPFQGEELQLAPCHGALQERYCATLSLPHPPAMRIARGQPHLFGRGVAAFAALRVLDAPHFLQHSMTQKTVAAPASADQLGLSRRACRIEATSEGLKVTREAPNQALFHLDAQCQLVRCLEPANQPQGEASPFMIPDGHHLLAGNYVLRYAA